MATHVIPRIAPPGNASHASPHRNASRRILRNVSAGRGAGARVVAPSRECRRERAVASLKTLTPSRCLPGVAPCHAPTLPLPLLSFTLLPSSLSPSLPPSPRLKRGRDCGAVVVLQEGHTEVACLLIAAGLGLGFRVWGLGFRV